MTASDPFGYPPPTGPPLARPDGGFTPSPIGPLEAPTSPVDRRPWWGMGDVVLGFLLMLVVSGAVGIAVAAVVSDGGASADASDDDSFPLAAAALSLVALQLTQGLWPVVVARWKGFGVVRDFRLEFRWRDLLIGPVAAFVALFVANIGAAVVAELLNVDPEASSNTDLVTDAEGTPWLFVFVLATAIGAPITEELFFRGLTLRAIGKRFGPVTALFGSSLAFTLLHFSGGGWAGAAVIYTAIGIVGLILGLLAVQTGRLGSPIIAHMVFNSVVVASLFIDAEEAAGVLGPALSFGPLG